MNASSPDIDRFIEDYFSSENLQPMTQTVRRSLLARIDAEPARVATDRDGLIISINPSFTRLCGFRFDEIRGRKPGHFLHGPDTEADQVRHLREAIASRQPVQAELINYHKNGSPYRVRIEIEPVYAGDGAFRGFEAREYKLSD